MKGKALRGNTINYGDYGLVAMEPGWIKSNQIEAARRHDKIYQEGRTGLDQNLPS